MFTHRCLVRACCYSWKALLFHGCRGAFFLFIDNIKCVASIIIRFALQKPLVNLFAGIQIAFTQPIKIDDAVVVEKE